MESRLSRFKPETRFLSRSVEHDVPNVAFGLRTGHADMGAHLNETIENLLYGDYGYLQNKQTNKKVSLLWICHQWRNLRCVVCTALLKCSEEPAALPDTTAFYFKKPFMAITLSLLHFVFTVREETRRSVSPEKP